MSPPEIRPAYLTPDYIKKVSNDLDKHLKPHLDQKCLNKMNKALKNRTNLMFERIVGYYGIWDRGNADPEKDYFIGLSDRPKVTNRNEEHLEKLIKKNYNTFQQSSILFLNPTKYPTKEYDDKPSERITNADIFFHTFESDSEKLNRQLTWLVGEDCLIDKIYKRLADSYDDFRGLYCVWSGNKSIHLHTEWSLKHLSEGTQINNVPNDQLRNGLIRYWEVLNDEIVELIKEVEGYKVTFDDSLKQPEMYRRLPWGERHFTDKAGVYYPKGSVVPQIELWAKARDKPTGKSGTSKGYLHKQKVFDEEFNKKKEKSHQSSVKNIQIQTKEIKDFIAYVKDITRCHLDSQYPEPMIVEQEGDFADIKIKFRNGAADKNPESYIKANNWAIDIKGNPCCLEKKHYILPYTANELWQKFKGLNIERLFEAPTYAPDVKTTFKKIINNPKTYSEVDVREAMGKLLPFVFKESDRSIILAPEGAGKTTALLKTIPKVTLDPNHTVVVASHSYKQAEIHRKAFNAMTQSDPNLSKYQGFVLPSFSHVYKEIYSTGNHKIENQNTNKYRESGYTSLLEAVYTDKKESAVVKELENFKKNLELKIKESGKIPVFFTVHDVIQTWYSLMGTRTWLADNFKIEFKGKKVNYRWDNRLNKMNITHVIYDEIKRDDLRTQHSKEDVEFYEKVKAQKDASGGDLYGAYKMVKIYSPKDSKEFNKLIAIEAAKYSQDNLIVADSSCEKIGINNKEGEGYYVGSPEMYVKEKKWWIGGTKKKVPRESECDAGGDGAAADTTCLEINCGASDEYDDDGDNGYEEEITAKTFKMIILTTERSLFELVKAIDKKNGNAFYFYDLDFLLPLSIEKATTELWLDKQIKSKNIKIFSTNFSALYKNKNWKLITNKCGNNGIISSHAEAKGKNDYTKGNVASTYMFPADGLYFSLIADNVAFCMTNNVKSHILDEFNQSVGRNLGFRYNIGYKSRVYMTPKFAGEFLYFIDNHSRYYIDKSKLYKK